MSKERKDAKLRDFVISTNGRNLSRIPTSLGMTGFARHLAPWRLCGRIFDLDLSL